MKVKSTLLSNRTTGKSTATRAKVHKVGESEPGFRVDLQ